MKKLLAIVLTVMLSLSAYAQVDKAAIRSVQEALNEAGYDCGKPDGAAGKKTKAAISAYQADHGMAQTGEIDAALMEALGVEGDAAGTAADDAQQEITFQGIPWGATPEEAKAALVEAKLIASNSSFHFNDTIWTDFWSEHTFSNGFVKDLIFLRMEDIGGQTYVNGFRKNIGGYEVSALKFNYLYRVEDEKLVKTPTLALVEADLKGEKDAFDDLSEKLTDVYGKYTQIKDSSWFGTRVRFWKGGNNTAIALMNQLNDGDVFRLYYGKTDVAGQVKAIQQAAEAARLAKVEGMGDAGL